MERGIAQLEAAQGGIRAHMNNFLRKPNTDPISVKS